MSDLPPLIVDMDGTLLQTDVTFETIAAGLRRRPLSTLAACLHIVRGRAAFKRALAALDCLDLATLPLRENLLGYLRAQHAAGRALYLVSGADAYLVEAVARRVGLFSAWVGSDGRRNLKGAAKAQYLRTAFPEGFVYAGDAGADVHVWRHARAAVLVAVSARVRRRARALTAIEAEFNGVRFARGIGKA